MSWEGYYEYFYANGHMSYDWAETSGIVCPECKAMIVYTNVVDETNGCGNLPDGHCMCGAIDDRLLTVVVPAKIETCGHCGHMKEVESPRYKIPTKENVRLFVHIYKER